MMVMYDMERKILTFVCDDDELDDGLKFYDGLIFGCFDGSMV